MTTPNQLNALYSTQSQMSSFFVDIMGIYNVKSYGALGDGITDDYTSIYNTEDAADANGGIIFFPVGTYLINSDITFDSNITLWFSEGAKLSIATGKTVTINGSIAAGSYQIFSGLGTVAGYTRNNEIDVMWFNGVFQSAINLLSSRGGTVFDSRHNTSVTTAGFTITKGVKVILAAATYSLTSSIKMLQGSELHGQGSSDSGGTYIRPSGTTDIGNIITNDDATDESYSLKISNLRIDGIKATNNGYGIYLETLAENSEVSNVYVTGCKKSCIKLFGKSLLSRIVNVYVGSSDEYGVEVDFDTDGTSYQFDSLSGDGNTSGLVKLYNGGTTSNVTFINLKSQRTSVSKHDPVIDVISYNGAINILGMYAKSTAALAAATQVIKVTTCTPYINLIGGSQTLYTNWIKDMTTSATIATSGAFASYMAYGDPDAKVFVTQNTYTSSTEASATDKVIGTKVTGDTVDRFNVNADGKLSWGSGSGAADVTLYRGAADVLETPDSIKILNSAWNAGTLRLGSYYIWVDGSGNLRVKSTAPSSDTDGTIVGNQGSTTGITNYFCSVYMSGNQTASSDIYIPFDSELEDTNTMHDTGTNPERITVPENGLYLVDLTVSSSSQSADWTVYAYKNTNSIKQWTIDSTDFIATTSFVVRLAANDYVKLRVVPSSGTIVITKDSTYFAVTKIGE